MNIEKRVDDLIKKVDEQNSVINELSKDNLNISNDNDLYIIGGTCKVITFEYLDTPFPQPIPPHTLPQGWRVDSAKIKVNDEFIYYENVTDSPNKKLHFPNLNFRSYVIDLITKENNINLQLYINTPEYDEQLNQYVKTHIKNKTVQPFMVTYLNTIYHIKSIYYTPNSPSSSPNADYDIKRCIYIIPTKEPQCDTYHMMTNLDDFKFDCTKRYKIMHNQHLIKEFNSQPSSLSSSLQQ